MLVNAAAHLDQSAQRSLGVGGAGVEQDAVADARQRVDPLPDRAGRIAAFEGDRGDQQVREGMQHQVRQAEELPLATLMLGQPAVETRLELPPPLDHVRPR